MIDEFQDTSQARADFAAALVDQPGRYLFCVGDDWQSINRFAGADPTVMTTFHQRFGAGVTVNLEQTFRSPQNVCHIAGRFISRNPAQLSKTVHSQQPEFEPAVRSVAGADDAAMTDTISRRLDQLEQQQTRHVREARSVFATAEIAPAPPEQPGHSNAPTEPGTAKAEPEVSVAILSRTNKTADGLRAALDPRRSQWPHLNVSYRTAHSAKGAEADHVVVAGLVARASPAPSRTTRCSRSLCRPRTLSRMPRTAGCSRLP